MNLRTRVSGRLRAALPTVLAVAFGVSQVLGGGGGFTDQARLSGSSASTATLVASTPAATAATATSIDLAWDDVAAGNTAAEFTLQRSATADGANSSTVYTGTDSAVTDPGNIPAELATKTITAVSVGGSNSCAIADGAAYCWGFNSSGQLGNGTTTASTTPVAVTGLTGKTVTAISSGWYHTCAIADGAAYCWGNNSNGQLGNGTTTNSTTPVAVTGLTGKTVTAISSGWYHTCAIADGAAYCWGNNVLGQLGNGNKISSTAAVAVTGLTGRVATAIGAGNANSCVIADGNVYCWGNNSNGQLGNGTTTDSITAVAVIGLPSAAATAITMGWSNSCAIANGAAYCWGNNSNGQLGNGTTTNSTAPVAVSGLTGKTVTAISTGGYHSCVIAADTAYCWGYNNYGQLGNGTTTRSTTAVAVTGMASASATAISAGWYNSCTVAGGASYCSGDNTNGLLGNGGTTTSSVAVATTAIAAPFCAPGATLLTATTCSLTPDTAYYYKVDYAIANWTAPSSAWVAARSAPVTLTASTAATAAASTTSVDLTWGAAPAGTTGAQYTVQRSASADGSNPETVYTGTATSTTDTGNIPTALRTKAVSAVSVGGYSSCAIADGAAYCWGSNYYGQLGDGTTTNSSTPVAVTGLTGKTITGIITGTNHSCAIADGSTYCWGANYYGQLGDGTTTNSSTPVAVTGLTGTTITSITTSWYHSCALTTHGIAYCWGFNGSGQLGNGTRVDSTTAVAVTGLAGTTVSSIAAGTVHTCALTSDGTAYCWGNNGNGRLGDGTITNSSTPVAVTGLTGTTITDIGAGNTSACALTSDDTVYCWGYNLVGQLGNGTTADSSSPVAVTGLTGTTITGITVGGDSACALTSDGTAYCWGNNNYGQLGNGATTHSRTAVAVTGLTGGAGTTITTVIPGQYHSCALTSDGTAYCWGFNSLGQVGNGTSRDSSTPVAVTPIQGLGCESGATMLTATTCSLTPNTTYYYRVDYTVGSRTSPAGAWTALATKP